MIYNGGLKDWKKSGYATESIAPLPEYDLKFITAAALLETIQKAGQSNCRDSGNQPFVTIIDYRTEHFMTKGRPVPYIKTNCQTIHCLLDDLQKPDLRKRIPRKGPVVVISETGNRDWAAIRFLSKWGYTNIVGLQFGVRGWIKSGYSVEYRTHN